MAQTSLNSTGVASSGALSLQSNGTTEAIGISTGQVATLVQNPILTSGTANGVAYLNGSKVLTTGSALVFDGTNLGVGVPPSAWGGSFKAIEFGGGNAIYSAGDRAALSANAYYNSSAWTYKTTGGASRYEMVNNQAAWYNAASGTAGNAISFTQAMTLDASGNLLVGNTSASSLAASGRGLIESSGSTDAAVTLKTGNTINGYMYADASAMRVAAGGSLPLILWTNSAERARIDSSGNLLVGTTSTSVAAGGLTSQFAAGESYFNIGHKTGTGSGAYFGAFSYNGSIIGGVTQNGTTGVLYNLTSDYRLKNNPEALTGAKDFVMALQPKKWQWWDGSGEGVGFIAHEFMEVAKYSGQGTKDAVDAEGKPVYQSIQPSSSEVMANLVAHIQDLETRLAALEA